jgi:hypothetical protein
MTPSLRGKGRKNRRREAPASVGGVEDESRVVNRTHELRSGDAGEFRVDILCRTQSVSGSLGAHSFLPFCEVGRRRCWEGIGSEGMDGGDCENRRSEAYWC